MKGNKKAAVQIGAWGLAALLIASGCSAQSRTYPPQETEHIPSSFIQGANNGNHNFQDINPVSESSAGQAASGADSGEPPGNHVEGTEQGQDQDQQEEEAAVVKQYKLPEGFVYLDEVLESAHYDIRYNSDYNFVGERIDGYKASTAIMTEKAAEALQKASEKLAPLGYELNIYDGYRPAKAVAHFIRWSKESGDDMKELFYPDIDKSRLFKMGYLSSKSAHSRGSTVDLSIVHKDTGEEVDMGSSFDYLGERSHHGTTLINAQQTANRNVLKKAMEDSGFRSYSKEWWHYTLNDEPFPKTYFDFDVE
ncbi:M15 family metallopeptidase [Paenibacillus sp. GCM10012307]|uniref:D-alanyl-D-alanine dipeptidase n=1 Tax=Paenibacillus roseus TaxID=2798579 RepID=A0A934J3U0_9BACL|nr:M15 family metallopeptidase [Paenibacillus roseus]MBJ6360321.1 M15 family metallopeptidase [Paenibacillus roseus]